jgi:hypothetical protein
MYKILNNMAPVYLRDHFKMSFTDQAYSLRNRARTMSNFAKSTNRIPKEKFCLSGAKVWNELPDRRSKM